jgi:Putative peptidoglycan binding domain
LNHFHWAVRPVEVTLIWEVSQGRVSSDWQAAMVDHPLDMRLELFQMSRRRPHRLSLLAGAVLAVAVAAPACSSSSHSSSTASSVSSTTNGAAATASNKALQQGLAAVGCYAGPIDGIVGPSTVAAIKNFQKAVGLSPDGVYGAKTQQHLQAAERNGTKVCSTSTSTTIPKSTTTIHGGTTTTSVPTSSTTQAGTTTTSAP